jgi:DNA polymerase-3 subunit beta
MKFICDRSVLLKEISIAQEVILSKNAISILSNIYLEAHDNTLIVKSTDIKVNFETKVPVTVVEDGSTTVFGDKFFGILSRIPDGDVEFYQKDSKTLIKTSKKKIEYQLKSIASDKFPEFPVASAENTFELPVKEFKEMVTQTVFAVSDDEIRYFMNGVLFEKQENKFIMVGTDGRRLAYIETETGSEVTDFSGVIIPPKILNIIMKHSGDEGLISVSISDKMVFFKFGAYQFSSVLIEGQFPNYRRVIPETQTYSFVIDRLDMIEALNRVSLMVEQKSRRVYMQVKSGTIFISSEGNDIGDAKEEIPCKYEGEDVSIALNYRYIEEPLKVMEESEVIVYFTEANRAITIKPLPEKNFFHIIMPMNVD